MRPNAARNAATRSAGAHYLELQELRGARLTAHNLLVLDVLGQPASRTIADYYCSKRAVSATNRATIDLATWADNAAGDHSLSYAEFTAIAAQIQAAITATGNTIWGFLLCGNWPSATSANGGQTFVELLQGLTLLTRSPYTDGTTVPARVTDRSSAHKALDWTQYAPALRMYKQQSPIVGRNRKTEFYGVFQLPAGASAQDNQIALRVIDDSIAAERTGHTNFGRTYLVGSAAANSTYSANPDAMFARQTRDAMAELGHPLGAVYTYNVPGHSNTYPPEGAGALTARVGGTGFVPTVGVGLHVWGDSTNRTAYYGADSPCEESAHFGYRQGAIAVLSQSNPGGPPPHQTQPWEEVPAAYTAVTAKQALASAGLNPGGAYFSSQAHVYPVNAHGFSKACLSVICTDAGATTATVTVSGASLTLTKNGATVFTYSLAGRTLKQVWTDLKAQIPADWVVTTYTMQMPSRVWRAIVSGCAFAFGSEQEPLVSGMGSDARIVNDLWYWGLNLMEWQRRYFHSNGTLLRPVYTVFYGDPLYQPFQGAVKYK